VENQALTLLKAALLDLDAEPLEWELVWEELPLCYCIVDKTPALPVKVVLTSLLEPN